MKDSVPSNGSWQIEEQEKIPSRAFIHNTYSLSECCILIKKHNFLWNQTDLLCMVLLHSLEIFQNHLINIVQDSIFHLQEQYFVLDYCNCQIYDL